jgi:hypothetical protein
MAEVRAIWNGESRELSRLMEAIEHNCQCDPSVACSCGAWSIVFSQGLMNHMAFISILRAKLQAEEQSHGD